MKKNVLIAAIALVCVVYCSSWQGECEKNKALEERIENYRKIVRNYQEQERVVWKYAKSLPDSFLLEFYPNTESMDSMRTRLSIDYEHYGEDGI